MPPPLPYFKVKSALFPFPTSPQYFSLICDPFADPICQDFPFWVEVREASLLLEVGKYLVVHWAEPSVGTRSRLLRQQNIHVLVFDELVGSLVDSLAAELVFLPTVSVVDLTAQGYDSITALFFFKQPWCALIVGCMFWSVYLETSSSSGCHTPGADLAW